MFKKAVAPARRVPGLQRARRRGVLFAVRWASERCENKAGGLFQHPARRGIRRQRLQLL